MAVIGVDLGGTKLLGVLADGGEVKADAKQKTPTQGGPLAVVDAIVSLVSGLGGPKAADAMGVGAPGLIVPGTGVVARAPNLPGWVDPFALGAALSDLLDGIPVAIDNDVNVAALAEHRLGAAKGESDVLAVFVGTGVGGGLILRGKAVEGATGAAGELGHTIVQDGGRECGCGKLGHVEAYAGRGEGP